jgi:hypothetical protein
MVGILPLRKSLLTFPGGRPGFNPNHIAVVGAPYFGVSAVPIGNRFYNLVNGKVSVTGNGTVTAVNDVNGPSVNVINGGGNYVQFTGLPTTTDGQFTMACIVFPTATLATSSYWMFLGGSPNAIGCDATSGQLGADGGGGRDSGIVITPNNPWFVAVSMQYSSGNFNFAATNLRTGRIQTANANHVETSAANTGTLQIGTNFGGGPITGNIACVMHMPTYLSLQALAQWAADPWSYWYPNRIDFVDMFSAPSGTSYVPYDPWPQWAPVLST